MFFLRHARSLVLLSLLCASSLSAYEGTGGYDAPYFQADYYQDLTEWSSALVNPALLYRVNQLHLDLGTYRWAQGGWGYQQVGFLVPIRRNQTAGLTVLNSGVSITESRINPNGWTIEEAGSSRFDDFWFIANYGVRLRPWFMLGGNLKFRVQNKFREGTGTSTYPGIDLGVYFNPVDHYRFGDLGFSINFQDIVPAEVEWKSGIGQNVTTRLRTGLRYALFNDKLVAAGELVIDNALADIWQGLIDSVEFYDLDTASEENTLDVSRKNLNALRKVGRFSGHLHWQFIPQVWLKAGWNNNNIPYLGLNINLMYPLPEMINYMSADVHCGYSFLENLHFGTDERGFTIMSKLSAEFGPTREQRESKRLYDKLILAPMNAYNEAMRLYVAGKYWLASFAFGKVMTLFPNFHLNDKATFYMGNCYRNLYMNELARQVYEDGLEKYTTSEVRPRYLYGLMNVAYREGRYEDALKHHAFIVNLYGDSDTRPDADYLAGEIHFIRKNYHAAEQLFNSIGPDSPSYLYAQYTLAIINIENKKSKAAVTNLHAIVDDTTQNVGRMLLIDAANTKLGHLYFEEVELRQAVEAYKRVEPSSPYGDEAMLGMSWSWIKANQPSVANQVLDRLLSVHPNSPLVPEAYLLKGYANMLLQRYPIAQNLFEECVELCKGDFITEADLSQRQSTHRREVENFRPTGDEILKNALRRPTQRTMDERVELRSKFETFDQENSDFFEYTLKAKSHKKFLRRKEQILMDAEYALAKVSSRQQSRKEDRMLDKAKKETQEIDEEIEKLQQQLQEIE